MKHGSLFSGIGGFDLAAEWMRWENVFHCEINEFCQKVLSYHFPNAQKHGDINTTDFSVYRGKCDIVTAGFPCQPFSTAGKRKGDKDDRHLWPSCIRAIREIQPRWVVGENVPGLINWERGMVLAEIYADLEAAGFEVFPPVILPACGKNAPHRRDRLWVVAYNNEWGRSHHKLQTGRDLFKERIESSGVVTNGHARQLQERIEKRKPQDQSETETRLDHRLKRSSGNGTTINDWTDWPTQSAILGGDDGISNRVDRIKALGNAIVPQVAYEIFKVIEEVSNDRAGHPNIY